MMMSRERGLKWLPAVFPLILIATAAATSCGKSDEGTKASGEVPGGPITGVWKFKEFRCAKGAPTEQGKKVNAALKVLGLFIDFKGAESRQVGTIPWKSVDEYCLSSTPTKVVFDSEGHLEMTTYNSKETLKAQNFFCEKSKDKDEVDGFTYSLSDAELVLKKDKPDEGEELCGKGGHDEAVLVPAKESDIPSANGKVIRPTPTPSDSDPSSEGDVVTSTTILGTWLAEKTVGSSTSGPVEGKSIYVFSSGGTYLHVEEGSTLFSSAPCYSVSKGTWSTVKDGVQLILQASRGDSNCMKRDYNPTNRTARIFEDRLRLGSNQYSDLGDFKKVSLSVPPYDVLAAKFESRTLEITDADFSSSSPIAPSPWPTDDVVCHRIALWGSGSPRQYIDSEFTVGGAQFLFDVAWEESDANPENYDGPAPGFSLARVVGGDGNGEEYQCSDKTDCAGKCDLKTTGYSLSDQKGVFEYTCTNLAIRDTSSTTKLLGDAADSVKVTVSCNYKPKLID